MVEKSKEENHHNNNGPSIKSDLIRTGGKGEMGPVSLLLGDV